jgi:hypothetical protein
LVLSEATLKLDFPWDGDVLNRHDGEEAGGRLKIEARGTAWPGATVACGGAKAVADGEGKFALPAEITKREDVLAVTAEGGGQKAEATARLLWDANSRPRYRFSLDDNVEFLADLGREPEKYPSLFDHWYLAFWRDIHRDYGSKIHINIYLSDGKGFTLDQLSDRWRGEWADNSGWLHLSFHARADKPDRIYKDAGYDELAGDMARVHEEILRFAGPEVMTPVTTVHWAETTREGAKAARDAGYRGLIILADEPAETCTTRYYLDDERIRHIAGRDAWKDYDTDLLFIECDIVANGVPLAGIGPHLERKVASPGTCELMELLIHEQYFRKELMYYQPDVMEKVREAIGFVAERDYEPVFWGEEFFGDDRGPGGR